MVDLGGYVIILVETHDKRVKLYGKDIFYTLIKIQVDEIVLLQKINYPINYREPTKRYVHRT